MFQSVPKKSTSSNFISTSWSRIALITLLIVEVALLRSESFLFYDSFTAHCRLLLVSYCWHTCQINDSKDNQTVKVELVSRTRSFKLDALVVLVRVCCVNHLAHVLHYPSYVGCFFDIICRDQASCFSSLIFIH